MRKSSGQLIKEKKNLQRRKNIKLDIQRLKERASTLEKELKRTRTLINDKYEEFNKLKEGVDGR